MRQIALDFREECGALQAILAPLSAAELETPTLFKSWTINDIIAHLHLWNIAADLTLNDAAGFETFIGAAMAGLQKGQSHRQLQDAYFKGKSGQEIYKQWAEYYPAMAERFGRADPSARVKWAGPDMSVAACITARQMEHWAHAQAIYDVLGLTRRDHDRLKNIAHIGVTTYSWSFKVHGQIPPTPKPYVRLTAPSGVVWEWNEPQADNRIEGCATQFCQVVTQCRNVADTSLRAVGQAAQQWMQLAQCFAGGPEIPPAKGLRHTS